MNERIELANGMFVRCFSTERRGREGVFFFFVFLIVHTWIPWSCAITQCESGRWDKTTDARRCHPATQSVPLWRNTLKNCGVGIQKNTPRAAATEATCEDINGVPQTALQLSRRKRQRGAPFIMNTYEANASGADNRFAGFEAIMA